MRFEVLAAGGLTIVLLWQLGVFHAIFRAVFSTILNVIASLLGILTGLSLYLGSGKHREPKNPKQSEKVRRISRVLEQKTVNSTQRPYKHKTLVSRSIDQSIQEVFDFFVRDFCLSWFRVLGKDEAAFVDLMTEELWAITSNVVERLKNVDKVNFLSSDLVDILTNHFQSLRLADQRNSPETAEAFVLHHCLTSKKAELDYLRKISDVILYCFLSERNSQCPEMRVLLREILAYSVFQPLADMLCDPDYINQTVLIYLEAKETLTAKHKPRYAYAETYEDFIRMINTCNSVEELKQIRYHIIAEIMQATTINNLRGIEKQNQQTDNQPLNKDAQLRTRNLKRYINQCTVAKAQCEKRIKLLGGPDYTSHNQAENKPSTTPEQKPKPTNKVTGPTKMLSFAEIMDNSLARSFFMSFLQNHTHSRNLLSFWMAIENLRLVKPAEIVKSTHDIYQVYVAPSSDKSIMLDTSLVRDMEGFLNGTEGLQSFFTAQKKVYQHLEEKFYRRFVLSQEYFMFVCQLEAEMDDLRAQQKDEDNIELNWNDRVEGSNDEEDGGKGDSTVKSGRKHSTIEERSESIVKKLEVLDQRLAAKTHQMEVMKRSYGADAEELKKIEQEINILNTERRHLEFHIERTDRWCENIGNWNVQIEGVEWNNEDDKWIPLYVIVVHCSPINLPISPSGASPDRLPGATSEGWVVTRKFNDFKILHAKLKECSSKLPNELPAPAKKWYKSLDDEFLNKSRLALEQYLQSLLADETLCLSEELYSFLSPSPEHLRKQTEPAKKAGFSLMAVLKSLPIPSDDTDEDSGIDQEDSSLPKDSIAEPFYALIGEVFELKGVFRLLRRTLIAFVQITFGGTINKEIQEMLEWLVSESMIVYYIHTFRDSLWPAGQLAKTAPIRTDEEKLETKIRAMDHLLKDIPEVLQNLVGKKNSRLGTIKVFEAFQDVRVNKHLFYVLLEMCIFTICPEVKSEKVLERVKELRRERLQKKSVDP
ncbi:sorting nexin-25 [Nematostella vectensis]|uniref:sorting nexin-25 n=1 Tax=Nematostella vectensis TaxID=45351 RepID=UPI002077982D|nr:sorting nexin-25 [Nematostella vectensis]